MHLEGFTGFVRLGTSCMHEARSFLMLPYRFCSVLKVKEWKTKVKGRVWKAHFWETNAGLSLDTMGDLGPEFIRVTNRMHRLYYHESHIGRALEETLETMVLSGDLKRADANSIAEQFKHSLIKFIRTEAPPEPFVIDGKRLAAFRRLQVLDKEYFLLKDVDVFQCFEPVKIQQYLIAQRWKNGEIKKKQTWPNKKIQTNWLRKLASNYFRIRIQHVPELLIVTHNPFIKDLSEGLKRLDDGIPYWCRHVRTNYNPYVEYVRFERMEEKRAREIEKDQESEQSNASSAEWNVPARIRRTKDYQKVLGDKTPRKSSESQSETSEDLPLKLSSPVKPFIDPRKNLRYRWTMEQVQRSRMERRRSMDNSWENM